MKLTLCIDKQSRNNPSNEIKEYQFDIGYPLRSIDDVYDEIRIVTDEDKKLIGTLIRRCYIDKYGVLKKTDEEQTQILDIPDITLFEGDNYVYIKEFTDLNMKIQYLTNAEMNKYFATKMELRTSIRQTMESILLEVSKKADDKEVSAMIKLLADEIDLKVKSDEIIASLNAAIKDGKGIISILGNYLIIDTDNFKLEQDGLLTVNNANIVGGKILMVSERDNPKFIIGTDSTNSYHNDRNTSIAEGTLILGSSKSPNKISIDTVGSYLIDETGEYQIPMIHLIEGAWENEIYTQLTSRKVEALSIIQRSQSSIKKNIKIFNRGLQIINFSDIYEYNFKTESDDEKKHIGLIIGDEYKCANEVIDCDNTGIDQYSMIAVAWQAIKEQQELINKLEKRIFELERRCNNE